MKTIGLLMTMLYRAQYDKKYDEVLWYIEKLEYLIDEQPAETLGDACSLIQKIDTIAYYLNNAPVTYSFNEFRSIRNRLKDKVDELTEE